MKKKNKLFSRCARRNTIFQEGGRKRFKLHEDWMKVYTLSTKI